MKARQAARRVIKNEPRAPVKVQQEVKARSEVVKPAPQAASKPFSRAPRPAAAATVQRAQTAPRPKVQPKPAALSSPEAGPSRLPMESQATAAAAATAPASKQIISSLFTAYPLPRIAATAAPTPLGAPSNAPLVGDANTFAGLGLDPLLVHHLENKMGIAAPTAIQKACLPYMLSTPLDVNARREEDEDGFAVETEIEGPRDVFIQSQTGSGKTLSFLLPIIQTLLPLSKLSYIDRSIGTLAIILAPTRELAQQISKVLESVLSMALSLPGEEEDRGYTRWLVSGLLVGGSTRTHEKARLRKGVPILVSTPGRLLDHLQNTASFQCSKDMFLVLDEADRLMDLGFEETLLGIIKALDGRRRNEINAEKEQDEEGGGLMRWPYWKRGRQTVLCSATVDAKVERLAGVALRNPVLFKPAGDEMKEPKKTTFDAADAGLDLNPVVLPTESDKFTPPSQLAQKYVVTPTKLRLVTLVALLRTLVSSAKTVIEGSGDGTKVIVFLSSTDSVDYHFQLLGNVTMGAPEPKPEEEEDDSDDSDSDDEDGSVTEKPKTDAKSKRKSKSKDQTKLKSSDIIALRSALLPNTTIHRLHGSLPLRTRLASLKAFATPSDTASILFATSVASRGLDLPLVRAVVQYDLPTEGGANEYVHRVGRTARAGKGGEAWAFVAPAETEWVPWVENRMAAASGEVRLQQVGVDTVLKSGFGGRAHEYEGRATDVQNALERWVVTDDKNATFARKAFASYIRAYSTHPLDERKFFHVKAVHLGHLAKAFALREAPSNLKRPAKEKENVRANEKRLKRRRGSDESSEEEGGKETGARNETERRMYEAVRKQGRAYKSGGALGAFGTGGDEYQIADVASLLKR